jgi:hypothetical protein
MQARHMPRAQGFAHSQRTRLKLKHVNLSNVTPHRHTSVCASTANTSSTAASQYQQQEQQQQQLVAVQLSSRKQTSSTASRNRLLCRSSLQELQTAVASSCNAQPDLQFEHPAGVQVCVFGVEHLEQQPHIGASVRHTYRARLAVFSKCERSSTVTQQEKQQESKIARDAPPCSALHGC